MKIALELESDRVAAGEPLAGRVEVLEGGPSRSMTLTVSFHERTRSYTATPYSSTSVLHEGELAGGETIPFTVTIPADAPPSVKCEHSELCWEFDVAVDEPGFDTHARRPFEVLAG